MEGTHPKATHCVLSMIKWHRNHCSVDKALLQFRVATVDCESRNEPCLFRMCFLCMLRASLAMPPNAYMQWTSVRCKLMCGAFVV